MGVLLVGVDLREILMMISFVENRDYISSILVCKNKTINELSNSKE